MDFWGFFVEACMVFLVWGVLIYLVFEGVVLFRVVRSGLFFLSVGEFLPWLLLSLFSGVFLLVAPYVIVSPVVFRVDFFVLPVLLLFLLYRLGYSVFLLDVVVRKPEFSVRDLRRSLIIDRGLHVFLWPRVYFYAFLVFVSVLYSFLGLPNFVRGSVFFVLRAVFIFCFFVSLFVVLSTGLLTWMFP